MRPASSDVVMEGAEGKEPILDGPQAQDGGPLDLTDVVETRIHPNLSPAVRKEARQETQIVVVADRRPDRHTAEFEGGQHDFGRPVLPLERHDLCRRVLDVHTGLTAVRIKPKEDLGGATVGTDVQLDGAHEQRSIERRRELGQRRPAQLHPRSG